MKTEETVEPTFSLVTPFISVWYGALGRCTITSMYIV